MVMWGRIKKSLSKIATCASYVASFGLAYLNDRETKRINDYVWKQARIKTPLTLPSKRYISQSDLASFYSLAEDRPVAIINIRDLVEKIVTSDSKDLEEIVYTFEDRSIYKSLKSLRIGEKTESYKRFAYDMIYDALNRRYESLKYYNKINKLTDRERDLMNRLYSALEDFYWNHYQPLFR